MKTIGTLVVAAALALSLTACGGTTMLADGERAADQARGNVSTTEDGTVNGTNSHHHHHDHPTTTPSASGSLNTNAMGAGNRG